MKLKIMTIIICSILSTNSFAGLFDWEYFEPAAGCAVGAGVGMIKGDTKDALIFCAVGAGVGLLINSHYQSKYGKEFQGKIEYLDQKLEKYNLLEDQQKYGVKNSSDNFFREVEVIPAEKDAKGQGVGVRVKETIRLVDPTDRLGK